MRRVLAECEAKRGIIEWVWWAQEFIDHEVGADLKQAEMEALGEYPEALAHLAAVYADRPGFREEWRS
jgi:IS5 family transposase